MSGRGGGGSTKGMSPGCYHSHVWYSRSLIPSYWQTYTQWKKAAVAVSRIIVRSRQLGCELEDLKMVALIAVGFRGFFRWNDRSSLRSDDMQIGEEFVSVFLAWSVLKKAMPTRTPEWSLQHSQSSCLSTFFVKVATNHLCPSSARSIKITKAVA